MKRKPTKLPMSVQIESINSVLGFDFSLYDNAEKANFALQFVQLAEELLVRQYFKDELMSLEIVADGISATLNLRVKVRSDEDA